MQLAILVVLIVILVVLAPWLLGVAAFLIAAYGVWVLVSAAVVALAMLVAVAIFLPLALLRRNETPDPLAVANKEFNRKYMEQANLDREVREADEAAAKDQAEKLEAYLRKIADKTDR